MKFGEGAPITRNEVAKGGLKNPSRENDEDRKQLDALNAEIRDLGEQLKQFGTPPKPRWVPPVYDKNGKILRKGNYVPVPWRGAETQNRIGEAIAKRDELQANAKARRQKLEDKQLEVMKAQAAYEDAVTHSTIHSLAGTVFGKHPSKVTDGELYSFLQFFIFGVSFLIALVSSVLNYCSFTRYPPIDEPNFKELREAQKVGSAPTLPTKVVIPGVLTQIMQQAVKNELKKQGA